MDDIEKLVHGKSGIKRIVGLEVHESETEIFIQGDLGHISSVFKPNRFWILASTNIDGRFTRLQGDLHYKWGRQFDSLSSWKKMRSIWKNEDIYTIWNPEEAAMIKDGYTFFRDMKLSDLSVFSFDIETTGLDGRADDAQILLISTTFRNSLGDNINKLFAYDNFESEGHMIEAFCDYVQDTNPTVIIGHNVISFDFLYLRDRADANGIQLFMGRDGSPVKLNDYSSNLRLDGTRALEYKNVSIYGRSICDTFFLVTSFDVSKVFESHALKPLVKQLGFEKENRVYYDAGSIRNNYKNPIEWKKIKDYAIADAEDSLKLFDHMAPLYFNMCPFVPKPFSAVLLSASGSKINGMMVRAYLQQKHSIPKADEITSYQGALSWGKPGIFKNVFKADCQSMYPSIIIQYEVFDNTKDPNAYLLQLVKIFRTKRLEYKKLAADTGNNYWKQMDTTMKGFLNSFYGFFGCSGLNFNSFECADFITATGREILSTAIKWATSKDFKEIAPEYFELHNKDNKDNDESCA